MRETALSSRSCNEYSRNWDIREKAITSLEEYLCHEGNARVEEMCPWGEDGGGSEMKLGSEGADWSPGRCEALRQRPGGWFVQRTGRRVKKGTPCCGGSLSESGRRQRGSEEGCCVLPRNPDFSPQAVGSCGRCKELGCPSKSYLYLHAATPVAAPTRPSARQTLLVTLPIHQDGESMCVWWGEGGDGEYG